MTRDKREYRLTIGKICIKCGKNDYFSKTIRQQIHAYHIIAREILFQNAFLYRKNNKYRINIIIFYIIIMI